VLAWFDDDVPDEILFGKVSHYGHIVQHLPLGAGFAFLYRFACNCDFLACLCVENELFHAPTVTREAIVKELVKLRVLQADARHP
jgi:hypothetical protein